MTNYLLIDTQNLYFRAIHVSRGDADTRGHLALHIMLASISKAKRVFGIDHVVFCTEGRSWRREIYPKYKANRRESREKQTVKEQEDNEILMLIFNDFLTFIKDKTNATYLHHNECEADDLIARWCHLHKDDMNVVLSTDSDFRQLINDHVILYDGVQKKVYMPSGHHSISIVQKDKELKAEEVEDPEYLLFKKIIRGDATDNVMSAYPGVREKGTSKKTGILQAFEDKEKQGFDWNNFMGQRWTDHNNEEHLVRDCFQLNETLIDLNKQPKTIKDKIDECITKSIEKEKVQGVGIHFLRFCNEHQLVQASKFADDYANILNTTYK